MKYGIIIDGKVTEPVFIPRADESDPIAWLGRQFPTLSGPWERVSEGAVPGAIYNGPGSSTNEQVDVNSTPASLSKTEFQDHAVNRLGGGLDGMARFMEIMDATRDSASAAVRFAFARYEAAQSFEKGNTEMLTAVMAGDDAAAT